MGKKVLFLLTFSSLILLFSGCKKNENNDDDNNGGETPSNIEMPFGGELRDVTIEISGAWTAKSDQPWCQLSQMSGTGNEKVQVNAAYNRNDESRTATITISASNGGMKRSSSGQTIVVTQEGNPSDEIPPHFTDVKFEDGTIWFKYWTGQGGNVMDAEGYGLKISQGGIADMVNPEVEIDWGRFYKFGISSGKAEGKLKIGNIEMVNTVKIDQSQTFWKIGESTNEGSCDIHFVLNGKLYYGGGYYEKGRGGTSMSKDFYCYDPEGSSHRQLNNLPLALGWAFVLDEKAYVVFEDFSLYRYDAGADSWSFMQFLTVPSGGMLGGYAIGSKVYAVCGENRHEYILNEGVFTLQSTVSHGFALGSAIKTVMDESGNIWLLSDERLYKHSNSGYTLIQDDVSEVFGAYADAVYYMKEEAVYKHTTQGSVEALTVIFDDLLDGVIVSGHRSLLACSFNTVTIDGNIYFFGGLGPAPTVLSSRCREQHFYCFSAKNYAPMNIMLVTDN